MNKELELLHNATIALGFVNMKLAIAQQALEKLACLGNGDIPGNSVGNCIAQEALELMKEAHNPPEPEPEQSRIVRAH